MQSECTYFNLFFIKPPIVSRLFTIFFFIDHVISNYILIITTNKQLPNVRGFEVKIDVPGKTRSQVYAEWLNSFDASDNRSTLFRKVRSGEMAKTHTTGGFSSFDSRPIKGTSREVGAQYKVYQSASIATETITVLKKDSYAESTYHTRDNFCSKLCGDDNGPHIWTSKATFEDNKAGGTTFTLLIRAEPAGFINCFGTNLPCFVLFPPICIQFSIVVACVLAGCCTNLDASGMQARKMASCRANAMKAAILKAFTNPKDATFPVYGMMYGGMAGALNGMMGATALQHQMNRMDGMAPQQQSAMMAMFGNNTGGVQMNTVPVATATAIPQVPTVTAETVEAANTSSSSGTAPPKE